MEKVAIYCRLSEEDRNKKQETDDSNSIQNQKAMLSQWNKRRLRWKTMNLLGQNGLCFAA